MRLVLGTLLLALSPLSVAEQVGPKSIEIPDIRGSVMKMLQEKGERPASSLMQEPESVQQEPPAADDLFEQAKRQMEQPPARKEAPTAPSVTPPTPPLEPTKPNVSEKPRAAYVPLPNKQITIEDLDDIEELKWEFDEAKKRQREQ